MRNKRIPLFIETITFLLFSNIALADETISWQSTLTPPVVLELFTSEGCSSCPPADQWISNWKNNPKLWKEIVPLVFHVDYWDELGWDDPFATASNSQRQRQYRTSHQVRSVYTPGFVVSGSEWKGWFLGKKITETIPAKQGILTFNSRNSSFFANFKPINKDMKPTKLNIAWLASGLTTHVTRGENSNRTLNHNFVVTEHQIYASDHLEWKGKLPELTSKASKSALRNNPQWALVIWVEDKSSPKPIQVVSGWLSPSLPKYAL